MRRGLMVLAAGTVVFGLAGCGGDDDTAGASGDASEAPAEASSEVTISDFMFGPAALTVPAGTTVTWTNEDSSPHAIQDDSELGAEEGPELAQGDTFQLTYDEPGTYPYICGIHNYMTGTVTVE